MREFCDSAKKGKPCIDSLCRTGGETLCGFDQDWYDELVWEYERPEEEYDNDDSEHTA